MSEVLSQEAISALVAAARSGALVGDDGPAGRRGRRARRVDFSRPTTFGSDQVRRLQRALDAFCRSGATRLSAELRTPVELEVIDVDQVGWSGAHGALPRDAIGGTLVTGGRRALLAAERPFVLAAVERLLGGGDRAAAGGRRLGEIDWALCRLVFELAVAQLAPVWEDLCGLDLALAEVEPTTETSHLAPVSEPTLALTIEARMARRSSTLVLLVPYLAVAGVADALAGGDHGAGHDPDDARDADAAVRAVDVEVRAEVARIRLDLGRVGALRPGDLLRLDAPVADGVLVYADDTPVFRADPGRLAARRAVQVDGRWEGPR
ncbi:FliM/FliN family flagellar motor switch protein [Patulibacter defluvii]|uniref:FliM/FliN family flagellar motor switch protein n=1 Tax=Patulibacter defluvii TaxID=3095358 RepID=UPI002A751F98|nr:FliM/FliN family flagellar motor switch protein [Patulibacter sp. DM4]